MKFLTDEELAKLVDEATIKMERGQVCMEALRKEIEKEDEDGVGYVGSIDPTTHAEYQKVAMELYDIAHDIIVDVEQRGVDKIDIFEHAVRMVTLSFQILSSSDVTHRRWCARKGITPLKMTDHVRITRGTLSHWRVLVDDNPKDLGPRIDSYLKDRE